MQRQNLSVLLRRKLPRIILPVLAAVIAVCFFHKMLSGALTILFGASAIAFLLEPLARFFERRLSRSLSALAALFSVAAAFLVSAALLLPSLIRQVAHLAAALPESLRLLTEKLAFISGRLHSVFPGLTIPIPSISETAVTGILNGTMDAASSVAGFVYRFSLMVVLSYFLLCDRDRLMIRLELLVPSAIRSAAVKTGHAVCRELKIYLRGQGLIALSVGILSAAALALVGVSSALVLGGVVGLLNMIPYFGPLLGGIPAVLVALCDGWGTALRAAAALWCVQQLDGSLISPRILGSLTGLSPGVVLMAIYVGSHFSGIVGMLFALPVVMAIRTVFRVFVQTHENV